MGTGKKLLCLYLSVALILSGCGPAGFMVVQDDNPVLTKGNPVITYGEPVVTKDEPVIEREKHVVKREKTKKANVVFLHRFQPRAEEYKRLNISKQFTVYSAQEKMKKESGEWRGFINTQRVILRNYGAKNGKRSLYGPGYLEPGHIFFAKFVSEDKDGNRMWRARFIGQCGNEIPDDDLMILETPNEITEKILSVERITNNIRTTITKNTSTTDKLVYTNMDYKLGLVGLLAGLGLGYLFWFGSGATQIVTAAGIPCPPGGPGVVPPVP